MITTKEVLEVLEKFGFDRNNMLCCYDNGEKRISNEFLQSFIGTKQEFHDCIEDLINDDNKIYI